MSTERSYNLNCLHNSEFVDPWEKMPQLGDKWSMHEDEVFGDCRTKKEREICHDQN